jgi:predicted dehydrogenase
MAAKIRVGIVGATVTLGGSGWGANAHVPALRALPEYELKAVCTAHAETARASAAAFGAELAFDDFDAMVARGDVDLVSVVVRVPGHRDLVVKALEAGKAVYTDKPIAHTLEDANRIAAAVADTGRVFAVGHSSRRLSGHREMKRWIDDGRIGAISLAEANFSNERGLELTPQTWRYYADKSPGGAFIQLGVHHADTLQYLLGPVKSVSAHARKLYTRSEVPDAIMAILEFESGPLGYIGTGWASPGVYTMNLLGTKANLMYDLDFTHWDESHLADDWSSLKSQFYGESERQKVDLPRTDMFREQLEEFALAIRGRATVEVGAVEAVRALGVVRAVIESSKRNGEAVLLQEVIEKAGVEG